MDAALALPATANLGAAAALAAQLGAETERRVRQGVREVVVDASALQVFDTATIALLLELRRRAAAGGATLRLDAAPPKLVQLATLYGVGDLLSGSSSASASGPAPAAAT
jgi:phospholipid transport system transporter-binding protein